VEKPADGRCSGGDSFSVPAHNIDDTNEEIPVRILLADSQSKVRYALRVLLERQAGIHVVGEAIDAGALLDMAEADCPDVVLLAWELPGMPAAQLIATLRGMCPDLIVIALSGRLEARRAALCAEVDGFVSKGEPPERLLHTISDCTYNLPTKVAVPESHEDRPVPDPDP
jgi:DNA-binding NarL/FixJ family response regulator